MISCHCLTSCKLSNLVLTSISTFIICLFSTICHFDLFQTYLDVTGKIHKPCTSVFLSLFIQVELLKALKVMVPCKAYKISVWPFMLSVDYLFDGRLSCIIFLNALLVSPMIKVIMLLLVRMCLLHCFKIMGTTLIVIILTNYINSHLFYCISKFKL